MILFTDMTGDSHAITRPVFSLSFVKVIVLCRTRIALMNGYPHNAEEWLSWMAVHCDVVSAGCGHH